MSDNNVNFSNNKVKINVEDMKQACNTENKIWWNTRGGYIIKTKYDPNNRSYHEDNLPYNLVPEGIPIKFQSNEIPHNK
jgi:hypothetical protein